MLQIDRVKSDYVILALVDSSIETVDMILTHVYPKMLHQPSKTQQHPKNFRKVTTYCRVNFRGICGHILFKNVLGKGDFCKSIVLDIPQSLVTFRFLFKDINVETVIILLNT